MCGASASQTQVEQMQQNFTAQLMNEHSTEFADFQSILGALKGSFSPILAAGPDQEGFGKQELTALNTQAGEKVAGDVKNAQEMVQGEFGGGDTFIPQGQEQDEMGKVASAGIKESGDLSTKIIEDDYSTGRANYWQAASSLAGVASAENPIGFAGAATSSGEGASKTANDIANAGNAWMAPVLGAVGGIAGAALKGPLSGGNKDD